MYAIRSYYGFIVANQTHSDHIELINEKETRGWETEVDAIANCDAFRITSYNVCYTKLLRREIPGPVKGPGWPVGQPACLPRLWENQIVR